MTGVSWIRIIFLIFGTYTLQAEEKNRFQRISLEAGLSHKTVHAVHQDIQGFMWFATQNGLDRYDGVRFVNYHAEQRNPNSLSANNVNSIVEDEAGSLWLGTWGGGLNRFDPHTKTVVQYRHDPKNTNSLSSDFIQCLFEGRNGILWIGTLDAGLNRFDRKTGEVARYQPASTDFNTSNPNRVWSIYEQKDGLVWVGTEQGLCLLNPRDDSYHPFDNGAGSVSRLAGRSIRVLLLGSQENLWLGTTEGLARIDLKTHQLELYPTADWAKGLDQTMVNVLHETTDGQLWIGSLYEGVKRLDTHTGKVVHYHYDPRDPYSVSGNDIRALFADRSGNLWVGTRGNGLSKLDLKPRKFRIYAHQPGNPNSLPFGDIRAITAAKDGALWVGTLSSGVMRIDRAGGENRHYEHDPQQPNSLSHNRVTALAFDHQAQLLVGTYQGLCRLDRDRNSFTRFYHNPNNPNSLSHGRVLSLHTDSSRRTWVGTQKGLALFKEEQFYNFEMGGANQLDRGPVSCIYEDRNQSIWVGMGHNGLFHYREDTNEFEAFHKKRNAPPALRNTLVLSIYDSGPLLWVGTMGGGLISMDHQGKTFYVLNRKDGLLNNTVCGILPEEPGILWLSTNKGLCRMNTIERSVRSYDIFDGLQSSQFSAGSYFRTTEGELFFGGIEGLNAFFPEEVQDHYFIPSVVVSSFKVDGLERNRDLAKGTELVLEAPQKAVTFEYAALDYTRTSRNMYDYKLEGIDPDWVNAGTRTFANYHNLATGEYTFRVKGTNHDGIWNTNVTSLKVTVTSPFFKTWFFYILYVVFFVALIVWVVTFFKYRQLGNAKLFALEKSQALAEDANRSKSAFLAHVSHELRTPLNAIIGFAELIEEDLSDYNSEHFQRAQCRQDLSKIKSSAYLQLAQVNNLLELTKIESGKSDLYLEAFDIQTMVNTVLHHIRPMLHKTKNSLEVNIMPTEMGEMTADYRKVQGILINLLSNANKYTKKGSITLSASHSRERGEHMIRFQISDTGCGLSPERISHIFDGFSHTEASQDDQMSGLGLYISRHFATMMGGELSVESTLNKGSTFSVNLPEKVRANEATHQNG